VWGQTPLGYIHLAMNYAVEIDGLDVDRGGRSVLRGLSARLQAGRVTGLLGPSGCGKTTLIRAIVGVQRVTGGDVRVLGEPAGSPSLRRRVAYVTQSPSVYADLTVQENLRYFASVLGVPPGQIGRALAAVDLADAGDQLTGTLSGGQRSRVSLAAALLGEPDLLVLDEPTVGLDPVLRRDLWTLFHRLAGDGATLLVSSHVMDEAARCDRLLLMREGGLVADTTPGELRERTGEQEMETAFLKLVEEAP
jgi:ABC-2 type transport system ATP-binding protein